MQVCALSLSNILKPSWWCATVQRRLALIAIMAAFLSASGFILEYGFNVLPCPMCWWQRYAHYIILLMAVVGFYVPSIARYAKLGIVLAALCGLGVAMWQFAAQHAWLPFPASCSSTHVSYSAAENLLAAMQATKVIPCDKELFKLFGLSLAGWNIPNMMLVVWLACPWKKV